MSAQSIRAVKKAVNLVALYMSDPETATLGPVTVDADEELYAGLVSLLCSFVVTWAQADNATPQEVLDQMLLFAERAEMMEEEKGGP